MRPLGGPLEPRYEPHDWTDRTITRWRLRVDGWLRDLESVTREVRCGLHSNFPPCCVAWYVLFYRRNAWTIKGKFYRLTARRMLPEPRYVPCPKCLLTGRKQTLLWCGCQRYKRPYPRFNPADIGVDDDE